MDDCASRKISMIATRTSVLLSADSHYHNKSIADWQARCNLNSHQPSTLPRWIRPFPANRPRRKRDLDPLFPETPRDALPQFVAHAELLPEFRHLVIHCKP